MPFALTPDDRPPRLLRFTELDDDVVAVLDQENNILYIDRGKYEMLLPAVQHQLIRTTMSLYASPPAKAA